jgi:hypothetical protein
MTQEEKDQIKGFIDGIDEKDDNYLVTVFLEKPNKEIDGHLYMNTSEEVIANCIEPILNHGLGLSETSVETVKQTIQLMMNIEEQAKNGDTDKEEMLKSMLGDIGLPEQI